MHGRQLTFALGAVLAACAAGRAADAPPSCKATLSFPPYGGLIKQDPAPACLAVPGIGDVYVGGAITGYAYTQSIASPPSTTTALTDRTTLADVFNLQLFL